MKLKTEDRDDKMEVDNEPVEKSSKERNTEQNKKDKMKLKLRSKA